MTVMGILALFGIRDVEGGEGRPMEDESSVSLVRLGGEDKMNFSNARKSSSWLCLRVSLVGECVPRLDDMES